MTDETQFNAELAWDILEWPGTEGVIHPDEYDKPLSRDEAKALAAFLTEKGYHKGAKGLTASLSYLEEVGAKLADEFVPIFETLRARKK